MKFKIIYTVGTLFLFFLSFSQVRDKRLKDGDKLYDKYAYHNSTAIYEKVANKGYKSVELFEKLGNVYFFNSLYAEANKWYTELFALQKEVESIYYYRYSQTLKYSGDNKKADDYLAKFSQHNSRNSLSIEYVANKNYLDEIEKKTIRYTIEDAGVNSISSDYGASVYKDRLVFTSTRKSEEIKMNIDPWTSDYYASLYSATLSKEAKLANVTFFSKEIQSPYNLSTPVFSKDGKTMYFTSSNYLNKIKRKSLGKKMFLNIFKATLKNGKWDNIVDLPFNSNEYNTAHPALSPDEKTLYFISDRPGGYGDSDIYKVSVGKENAYGNPENLGANINTQGKETFPFISDKNKLYFASDGRLGLGGLDVFVTRIKDDVFTNPVSNLGKPINSSSDDFCYFKLDNSNIGFFSSNRAGGQGKDDLYCFVEQEEIENTLNLENLVLVDKETQQPIADLVVTVYDINHNLVGTFKADKEGKFSTVMNHPKGTVFYVEIKSPEYGTQEITFDRNKDEMKNGVIALPKIVIALTVGNDLSKLFLDPILFDLNKYNIRKDVEVELQTVLEFMKEYPAIKIEIRAHTDSRQSTLFNIKLSQKRAKATMNYLTAHGIAKARLSSKAYGESQLLNKCADGVPCTEEEHQVNRRSEFIIIKM